MKIICISILLSISLLLTIGYSGNNTKNDPQSLTTNINIPDKSVCELFTKEKMSSITGITFNEEMSTLHEVDKDMGKYVSQCGYYSDGGDMGVLVRRFGNTSFPKEKEKIIGAGKTGDAELDAMLEEALATCKTISGLGDVAYFYNLVGIYNLVVIFDDHYQVHISSSGKGLGFDDKTLEISKKVAIEAMKLFKQ
jgi:hypothetical protein